MLDPGPIPAFLDRTKGQPLVGTYTALRNYLNCPHAMFHRNIAKTYPFVETDAIRYGNAIHSAFEKRLRDKTPLPETMAQWEQFAAPFDAREVLVEQKLGVDANGKPCDFFAKNVWFRVKIDAAVLGDTKAYLCDWKSGGSKYEDPFELEIGAMLLHAKYPTLQKIVGQFAWLAENRIGTLHALGDTFGTFKKMQHLMSEIERDRARGWFEKRQSGLCGYCPCEGCEHHYVARPK